MVPQLIHIGIRLLLGFARRQLEVLQIPLQYVLSIVVFDVSINISRLVRVDFAVLVGPWIQTVLRGSSGKDLIWLMDELNLLIRYSRNALPSAFYHLVFDRYFGVIHRLLRLVFPLP